jgi:acyl carrier protein
METFERIVGIVAEALYVDADQIKRESRLIIDLGAESIDFLDIVFRLEHEFGIEIPRGDIERRARGELSAEEFAVGGVLTDAALVRLRLAMPEVAPGDIAPGLMLRDIPKLMTIATFERLVDEQVREKVARAEADAAAAAAAESRPEAVVPPMPNYDRPAMPLPNRAMVATHSADVRAEM